MSNKADNWVWGLDLKPIPRIVLTYLAKLADEKDESWPRIKNISEKCNVSDRTVQRILKRFEEQGLISIVPRQRSDGSQTSNCYKLHIQTDNENLSPPHDTIASPPGDSIVSPSPDTSDTPGVTQLCQGPGDTAVSPLNTSLDTSLNTQLLQEPGLKFPPQLKEFECSELQKELADMPNNLAQTLLDELAGVIESHTIKTTPIRWFSGILQSHRQGTFVPSAGINIAHRRKQVHEQREARQAPSRDHKQRAQHANHHLTAIRELIKSATDD